MYFLNIIYLISLISIYVKCDQQFAQVCGLMGGTYCDDNNNCPLYCPAGMCHLPAGDCLPPPPIMPTRPPISPTRPPISPTTPAQCASLGAVLCHNGSCGFYCPDGKCYELGACVPPSSSSGCSNPALSYADQCQASNGTYCQNGSCGVFCNDGDCFFSGRCIL